MTAREKRRDRREAARETRKLIRAFSDVFMSSWPSCACGARPVQRDARGVLTCANGHTYDGPIR